MTIREDLIDLLRPHVQAGFDGWPLRSDEVERLAASIEDLFAAETVQPARVCRVCRVCGCTDDDACLTQRVGMLPDDPCWWVLPDLCSACAGPMIARSLRLDVGYFDPDRVYASWSSGDPTLMDDTCDECDQRHGPGDAECDGQGLEPREVADA